MGEVKTPRQWFLWSIALVYVCAFASIYVQIPGLYGDEGILPVRLQMPKVQRPLLEQESLLGLGPFLGLAPQQVLELTCLVGVALALCAVLLEPLRDSLIYFLLRLLYLSLYNVNCEWFQCSHRDVLLLEAGLLAVLVAPLGLLRRRSSYRYHDPVSFWLTRWLFFRLTFSTGVSKLASGDPAWYDLSALSHHLENQMNPTPLAWYGHQLPDWLLRFGAVVVLQSEIIVPLVTFFAPIRRLRLFGFYVQLFLQLYYILTGNCSLLNLLSITLSFSLLDEEHFNSNTGPKKKKGQEKKPGSCGQMVSYLMLLVELAVYLFILYCFITLFKLQINWEEKTLSSKTSETHLQAWWRRQYKREFFPIVNLDDPTLEKLLEKAGLKEKFPAQTGSDTPVSQAVSLIRDHVKGLSGSLLLSTLLATLAGIFLIKAVFSWFLGGRKPRPASADHKTRKPKEPSETAEKSQAAAPSNRGGKKDSNEKKDSDKSPRKRK
uniref:Lipase maturation factor n=1 Tax=Cyprinus carpio TaxID=7962 RepID=A0A8C1QT50_CYPCA